jgi:hypothetical protein
MADARMLRDAKQLVADGAALTAAGPLGRRPFVRGARHITSQMTLEIHALMQNADNFDLLFNNPKKDYMGTDRVLPIARANVIA